MRGDPRAEVTAVSAVRRIAVGAIRPLRRATSAAFTDRTDVTQHSTSITVNPGLYVFYCFFHPQLSLSYMDLTLFFSTHYNRRAVGEVVEG